MLNDKSFNVSVVKLFPWVKTMRRENYGGPHVFYEFFVRKNSWNLLFHAVNRAVIFFTINSEPVQEEHPKIIAIRQQSSINPKHPIESSIFTYRLFSHVPQIKASIGRQPDVCVILERDPVIRT